MRFSPGCNCCGASVACCGCAASPVSWSVTIPGDVGEIEPCGGKPPEFTCGDYTGTFLLTYTQAVVGSSSALCSWVGTSSGPLGYRWCLQCVPVVPSGVQYRLSLITAAGGFLPFAAFSYRSDDPYLGPCFGPITLYNATGGFSCCFPTETPAVATAA